MQAYFAFREVQFGQTNLVRPDSNAVKVGKSHNTGKRIQNYFWKQIAVFILFRIGIYDSKMYLKLSNHVCMYDTESSPATRCEHNSEVTTMIDTNCSNDLGTRQHFRIATRT